MNDIVLDDDLREGINCKLELWRKALESKGFVLNRSKNKMEYMEGKFNKVRARNVL